jgi:hypothetical protein
MHLQPLRRVPLLYKISVVSKFFFEEVTKTFPASKTFNPPN